jgi:hypothetical protein
MGVPDGFRIRGYVEREARRESCDLNPGTRPVRLRAASAERQRRFQQRRGERVRQITGHGGGGKD